MHSSALLAYSVSVFILFAKFVVTASLQGVTRLRTHRFRWPEDAAHWRGEAVTEEPDVVVRAQHLLRNDGEGQPYFLALGALYVALGAAPWGAWAYFLAYALSRTAHAYFLLRPRQPHRNRAFSLGIAALAALAVHCVVAAVGAALS